MKIVIINGSPRANGATGQLLSEIKNILLKTDNTLEVEYFDLGNMNLQPCTGCFSCYKSGHCYIKKDGLDSLAKKIEQCDGVVLGSPTYASNVSGHFKIMIDRIQFVFEQLLHNKACFSVVTYENAEGHEAQNIINKLIRLSGGSVSCQYLLKLDHGDKAITPKVTKQLSILCQKYITKAREEKPLTIFETIFRHIILNVGLKPPALKNKSRYKGIIDKWAKQGLL